MYKGSETPVGLFLANTLIPPCVLTAGLAFILAVAETIGSEPRGSFHPVFLYMMLFTLGLMFVCAWVATTAFVAVTAAVLIRLGGNRSPFARSGRGALVIHASCVFAPLHVLYVALVLFLPDELLDKPLLCLILFGVGLFWFGMTCFLGTRSGGALDITPITAACEN